MSALEPLAPDQRAVISLVLQQGRSYDEIATLLGMPVDAVRARAHAGLAALVRDNGLPPEVTGPLADYLLGQQPAADAEATRGLLADSEPARAWAADVAARLEDVAPGRLAEIPHAARVAEADEGGAVAEADEGGPVAEADEVADDGPAGRHPAPAGGGAAPRPAPRGARHGAAPPRRRRRPGRRHDPAAPDRRRRG